MGALATSLISSGLDLAGSVIGGLFGQSQSRKAWREQADYNSPVNQMKRLKLAGLNPNLVYGNGSVANTQSHSYDTAKPDASSIGSQGLQNYVALRNQQMQNDLIEKQQEFITAQVADKMSQIKYRDIAQTNKIEADTTHTLLSAEHKKQIISAFQANTALDQGLKRAQIASTDTNREFVEMQMLTYPKEVRAKLSETYTRIQKMYAEMQQLERQGRLTRAQSKVTEFEGELKRMHTILRRYNIEPTDNILYREMAQQAVKINKLLK